MPVTKASALTAEELEKMREWANAGWEEIPRLVTRASREIEALRTAVAQSDSELARMREALTLFDEIVIAAERYVPSDIWLDTTAEYDKALAALDQITEEKPDVE